MTSFETVTSNKESCVSRRIALNTSQTSCPVPGFLGAEPQSKYAKEN
jgi:hypothetical protein